MKNGNGGKNLLGLFVLIWSFFMCDPIYANILIFANVAAQGSDYTEGCGSVSHPIEFDLKEITNPPPFSVHANASMSLDSGESSGEVFSDLKILEISALWSGIPMSKDCSEYGGRADIDVNGWLTDRLFFERIGADSQTITEIPFQWLEELNISNLSFCSNYINNSLETGCSILARRQMRIGGQLNLTRLTTNIKGQNDEPFPFNGVITFTGPSAEMDFDLQLDKIGVDTTSGKIKINDMEFIVPATPYTGNYKSQFILGPLPPGVACRSESGVFPGCDGEPSKPDLSLSNVKITQAVFDSDKLVLNRQAVIMADVDVLSGSVSDPVLVGGRLGDQLIDPPVAATFANPTKGSVKIPITPMTEGMGQNLVLKVDPDNLIEETDENNNESEPQPFDVIETKQMVIPSMLLKHADCLTNSQPCDQAEQNLNSYISASNQFMWDIYPLADDVNFLERKNIILSGNPNSGKVLANSPCGIVEFSNGIEKDFLKIDAIRAYYYGAKRAIGFVPGNYFEFHDLPQTIGLTWKGIKSAIVEIGTYPHVAAHEIGHTFGFDEGYIGCGVPSGIPVNGFNVRNGSQVAQAFDFMDNPTNVGQEAWINTANWNSLVTSLNKTAPDPALLMFRAILHKDGTVETFPWFSFNGTPDFVEPGDYSLVLKDKDGVVLNTIPFGADFSVNIDPFGSVGTDRMPISIAMPFQVETATIQMVGPDGTILLDVDPVQKTLKDSLEGLPDQCFIGSEENDRNNLYQELSDIKSLIDQNNIYGAMTKLRNETRVFAEAALKDNCVVDDPLGTTKEKLLSQIDDSLTRLETRLGPDIDGDGLPNDVDSCPASDMASTVVIDGHNSGVPNILLPTGCSISDLIVQCAANASNHGDFVSCVSEVTNNLMKGKVISGKEKGAIQSTAEKAKIP